MNKFAAVGAFALSLFEKAAKDGVLIAFQLNGEGRIVESDLFNFGNNSGFYGYAAAMMTAYIVGKKPPKIFEGIESVGVYTFKERVFGDWIVFVTSSNFEKEIVKVLNLLLHLCMTSEEIVVQSLVVDEPRKALKGKFRVDKRVSEIQDFFMLQVSDFTRHLNCLYEGIEINRDGWNIRLEFFNE